MGLDRLLATLANEQFLKWLSDHPDATLTPVQFRDGKRGWLVWDGPFTTADAERLSNIILTLAVDE